MVFADFQLKTAVKAFDLSEDGKTDLFRDVEPIEPSEHLRGWLAEFAPVALGINTEQARRENIIAPILSESKRRAKVEIIPYAAISETSSNCWKFSVISVSSCLACVVERPSRTSWMAA
jgi:hypothetical protein